MAKFELCVRGENFLIKEDGKLIKRGFYAARGLEAVDMSTATQMAMDSFKAEIGDQVFNEKNDPPSLRVVEMEEVYYFQDELHTDDKIVPCTGFLWDEDEEDEVPVARKLSTWQGGWAGMRRSIAEGNLHIHTMLIHFTNALYPVAALFILLFLLFKKASFDTAYFYIMILATLSAPFSYLSGILAWRRRHQGAMVPIFVAKIRFGILIFLLGGACTLWRAFSPGVLTELNILTIVFILLNLSILPVVVYLGHLGGIIVYEGVE